MSKWIDKYDVGIEGKHGNKNKFSSCESNREKTQDNKQLLLVRREFICWVFFHVFIPLVARRKVLIDSVWFPDF